MGDLSYDEKVKAFRSKGVRAMTKSKTAVEDLPIRMGWGSSSHHPDRVGGVTTSDIVFWCKFLDWE